MPTTEQEQLLRKTMQTYRDACNAVSEVIFKEKGKV
ncbi:MULTISPECIES: hypothetical protein [Anoxybacillus]|nr:MULTISPECIES: hypothetical protein [Anoxybacillus]